VVVCACECGFTRKSLFYFYFHFIFLLLVAPLRPRVWGRSFYFFSFQFYKRGAKARDYHTFIAMSFRENTEQHFSEARGGGIYLFWVGAASVDCQLGFIRKFMWLSLWISSNFNQFPMNFYVCEWI
jgi:hypothetical protein